MNDSVLLSEAKRQLLQKLLAGSDKKRGKTVAPVVARPAGTVAPISAEQVNVWVHGSMAPDQPLYNESITIHRRGALDVAVLERAFNEILRRHEIWRTGFANIDGEIVQRVAPDVRVALPLTDLSALPPDAREAEALRLATEDSRRPLDLAAAPLLRARLVKIADDEHRLYLTLHHIIFDGVSIYRILVPELAEIYAAFAAGRPPDLPEPTLQYGDYAYWRSQRIARGALDGQLAYWRERLAGELPVLQLPTDRPRRQNFAYRGAMETFALSRALTERLKELSRTEGVTLYMTLLAAFKVLLHRYSGQDDIIVGGVTDTRRRPELQGLMGYFLNSLALRSRPQATMPFRAYLQEVRDTVLGALNASEIPFDRVVREVKPKRDASRHPLFQVLFSIEPPAPQFSGGWDLTQMDVSIGASKFDLYLELDERPDGLIARFLYSTELFDAETIRRMIGHWTMLLEGIVADPAMPLAELPLLTAAESRQILHDWNTTQRDIPQSALHHWFEATARAHPDTTAIVFGDESWSYRELDRRSTALAARLSLAGIGPETLVAIAIDRGPEMIAGLLAILKAGAAYLPLDPALPAQRFTFIIEDAKPAALLTQRRLQPILPATAVPVILCDDGIAAASDAIGLNTVSSPASLAYVLYTSGSTGKPKGVEIPHRALVNLLAAMRERPGFAPGQSMLAVTTLSFDIAALELFLPLVSGGTVILADRETVGDPTLLAALIAGARPSMMQATPATWRSLIEAGWRGAKDMTILCGGEALARDLADALLPRCAALWNMYGPTETTVWSTIERVGHGTEPVAIGKPIANTSIYILDAAGHPVPAGVIGEIYIGGGGLARGYRHRDALTRERFVACAAAPGERLYRTGDLGCFRRDGTIDCFGRTDYQLKIRGFRVAIEEVEAALAAHPRIAAAAARAWPDASGESGLAGYFVPTAEPPPSAAELRRFMRQSLPDYMIPTRFVAMTGLPMTPNRKIDRGALPAPESNVVAWAQALPEGEQETQLAAIWQDVLGIASVGRHDNFHELGGHSLLMAKLLTRIERQFQRRLSMASIFQAPSLSGMAALLGEKAAARPTPRIVPIQPNGTRPALYWLFGGATVRPLAEAMGDEQPFLGVALDCADEERLAHSSSLAEFAAPMLTAIREAQPNGPYFIGGWCTAGILAYEVARQLMEQGCEVGLLVLVHATNPVHYRRIGESRLRASKIRHHLANLGRLNGAARWRYAADRLRSVKDATIDRFRAPQAVEQTRSLARVLDHAALCYETPPYAGDVALFQPADRPDVLDYRPGWRDVVRGAFAAFEIAGGHRTMLETPYVAELAARMNACLRRAQIQSQPIAAPRRAAG
ncbi:MAG TPA: amino acid adenylation domain-containing protein [Stellaceae bacterium]|jgi:amino acid adenylation domain-containing protein|nr:amino acid adenylation domain-containing protein [Stellaceae bacterium]